MQPHDAVAIAAEHDVAAVAGHRRTHAGIQQFADLGDDLLVLRRDLLDQVFLGMRLRSPGGRRRNAP